MARSILLSWLRRAYQHASPSDGASVARPSDIQNGYSRRRVLQGALVAGAAWGLGGGGAIAASPPRLLIVGAGVAGLTVAYRLQQAGIAADVVEASPRVGGRLLTRTHWPGCPNPVELGGEFIDTRHRAVRALAHELGLTLADLREADRGMEPEIFFFQGQRISHQTVVEAFAPLATYLHRDLAAMGQMPTYQTANAAAQALDRLSLEEYLAPLDVDPLIKDLVRVAYVTEYGRDSTDQTCLNMLMLIGTEPGQWSTYGTSDERWHIVGGNEQLPKTLAQQLIRPIETETRVESIRDMGDNTYRVSLRQGETSRDRTYDGLVLAVPFSVLRHVELAVEMPPAKQRAIAQLGYGTSSKLAIPMRERIWRSRYSSTISVYTDQAFQNTWESARYAPGSSGWITNLRGGSEGITLSQEPPNTQARALVQTLEPLFPGISQVQRGEALRAIWAAEPHILGSYSCYAPGQWTAFGGSEPEPIGHLWFAGEHCSLESQGYVNGAVASAEAAAQDIRQRLGIRALV